MSDLVLATRVAEEADVVKARQQARRIASLLGFENHDQVRVATAVSEVARSALEHGHGGTIEFVVERRTTPQRLAVTVTDAGRWAGPDRSAERDEGFLGARRLMDRVEVETTEGGVIVRLYKRFPRQAAAITPKVLAKIAAAVEGEHSNPMVELARQNRELMQSLADNKRNSDAVQQLNQELQETNRGVVALYAELDEKAASLK
ncbi:MAG: ATP-binding protein, partial [Rhodospirillaceae bacterium]|nr:ATP-binding protein [Rhodospirillaceae bacterium]